MTRARRRTKAVVVVVVVVVERGGQCKDNSAQRKREGTRHLADRALDNARQTTNVFLVSESIATQLTLRRDRHGTCEARGSKRREKERLPL